MPISQDEIPNLTEIGDLTFLVAVPSPDTEPGPVNVRVTIGTTGVIVELYASIDTVNVPDAKPYARKILEYCDAGTWQDYI